MRNITIRIKLDEILESKGMTQKELAELTGLRRATVSEIVNNQRTTINREHLQKISDVLGIKSANDLFEIKWEE